MIYAITPTGCRQECFDLLTEYIYSQDYKQDFKWVIVDDCVPKTKIKLPPKNVKLLRAMPGWTWQANDNTQAQCLSLALRTVPVGATLFVFEDDDIYLPKYMTTMLNALQTYDLVGERCARYYNVSTKRCMEIKSDRHSSLAATAMKGDALELFRRIVKTNKTKIDFELWRQFKGKKTLLPTNNVIGIKGMPGRPGIGVGHRINYGRQDTVNVLQQWAGNLADNYGVGNERFN